MTKKPARKRNRVEAALLARPDDPDALAAYGDWLVSIGDPLGELLALERAGDARAVKKFMTKRMPELVGTIDKRSVDWRRGLVDHVQIATAPPARARKTLEAILDRPAAVVVREITLVLAPDRALLDVIARRAPALRKMFCLFGGGIGDLASASLSTLELYFDRSVKLDLDTLAPLLRGKRVPALRRIDFLRAGGRDKPLSLEVLEKLLASKLLKQLEWLAFRQTSLDADGIAFLIEHRGALAHLRGLYVDTDEAANETTVVQAFGVQTTLLPGTGEYAGVTLSVGSWEIWPA